MIPTAVKKIYRILVNNNFEPMSPKEIATIAGYKNTNSIDQVLKRSSEYFTINGKKGNRKIGIPKDKKKIAIFIRDNYHCVYCNKQLNSDSATLDHIVPRKNGDTTNLATSCKTCNNNKGDNDVEEFINNDLPIGRRRLASNNISKITGSLLNVSNGNESKRTAITIQQAPTLFNDENQLKRIIRSVVREELKKRNRYGYMTLDIVEMSGYWAWFEDDEEEYLVDDDDNPNSTLEDILSYHGGKGWRCIQLIENTQMGTYYWGSGKQYTALFEKAQ